MDEAANVIRVGGDEDSASILRRLAQLPQGSQVVLEVPSDAQTLRTLEDFNELRDLQRRNRLALTVVSPEQTIIGLARIYGFEVQNTAPEGPRPAVTFSADEEEETLPRWPSSTRQPAADSAYQADAVPAVEPGSEPVVEQYAPAQSLPYAEPAPPRRAGPPATPAEIMAAVPAPQAAGAEPLRDSDWLFEGMDDEAIEGLRLVEEERTSTPPPDVQLNMPYAAAAAAGLAGVADAVPAGASRSRGLGSLFGWRLGGRGEDPSGAPAWTTAAQAAGAGAMVGASPFSSDDGDAIGIDSASSSVAASSIAPGVDAPTFSGTPRRIFPDALQRTRSVTQTRYSTILPIALVMLVLLLFGAGFWAIYNVVPTLSTAQVLVVPRQSETVGPVAVSVPVSLGGAGGGATVMEVPLGQGEATPEPSSGTVLDLRPKTAPAVAAQLVQRELVVEETRPTTGERLVPNNSARGTIEFTNSGNEAVYIPGGTAIGTANGKSFVTAGDVTVPSTTVEDRTWGIARVDFVATEPGPDSNGAVLEGYYGPVYYFTVQASQGGDMRAIKQVTDGDVNQLLADLRGRIAAQAAQELLATVPSDMTAITTTVAIPEESWKPEFNHAVGEDADQLTLRLTAVPQLYAFRSADVDNAIKTALTGGLVVQDVSPSAAIDSTSISHGEILPAGPPQDGTVIYNTDATARIEYSIPPAALEEIRTLVAGLSPEDARAAVMSSRYGPFLADVQITLSHPLGWEQSTLPGDAARIEVTTE